MKFRPENQQSLESYDYDYFFDKQQRKDIFNFTKNTVELLRSLGESNVVFLDRSARAAYAAIDEYWNLTNDGLSKPGFYFFNPGGFDSKNLSVDGNREDKDILGEINSKFGDLIKDKHKPVVLVDACIHAGITVDRVMSALHKTGFEDIHLVVANSQDNYSWFKSEIPTSETDLCDIFGNSRNIIKKTNDSVVSSKAFNDPEDIRAKVAQNEARVLRRELRQIIKDGLGL